MNKVISLSINNLTFVNNFSAVMGHVMSCGLELIATGKGIDVDEELRNNVQVLESLAAKSNITDREQLHVKAVKEWAEG